MKKILVALALFFSATGALAMPAAAAAAVAAWVTAAGVTLGGTFGAFLIMYSTQIASVVIFMGVGLLARHQKRKAEQKARDAYNSSLQDRTVSHRSTTAGRDFVLGRVRKGGVIAYIASSGEDSAYLSIVTAVAAHKCDAIEKIFFNEEEVTLDPSDGGVISDPYAGAKKQSVNGRTNLSGGSGTYQLPATVLRSTVRVYGYSPSGNVEESSNILSFSISASNLLTISGAPSTFTQASISFQRTDVVKYAWVRSFLGTFSQNADAELMARFPNVWTSAHRLRGITYVSSDFRYNTDIYPSSAPNVSVQLRGMDDVYDPRINVVSNPFFTGSAIGQAIPGMILGSEANVAVSVVGTGIEGGMPYVDVRFSGIANSSGSPAVYFSSSTATGATAANGQTWHAGLNYRFVGRTNMPGANQLFLTVSERDNSGNQIAFGQVEIVPDPTTSGDRISDLTLNRVRFNRTLTNAATTRINSRIRLATTASQNYDFTIRIGLPTLSRNRSAVAWSENPALLCGQIGRHPLMGNLGYLGIDWPSVSVAANVCDQQVTYTYTDGTTEVAPIYRGSLVFILGGLPKDAMDEMVEAMAGKWTIVADRLVVKAGSAPSPVVSLGESDFAPGTVTVQPSRAITDVANIVTGTFSDAAEKYVVKDFPRVVAANYVALDGGKEYPVDVEYTCINHLGQCQQVAAVSLREMRNGLTVQAVFKMSAYPIEIFDVITLTNSRMGWDSKVFEVLARRWTPEGNIELTLKETAAAIYAFGSSFGKADLTPNTNLPTPWMVPTITGLAAESGTDWLELLPDGTVQARVRVTWDPVTSPAVTGSAGGIRIEYAPVASPDAVSEVVVPGGSTEVFLIGLAERKTYIIRARAYTSTATGDYSEQIYHTVVGKTAPPSNVAQISYTLEEFGVRLNWESVPDADLQHYELRHGGSSWATAQPLDGTVTTVGGSSYLWRIQTSGVYLVRIKAVDTSNNASVSDTTLSVVIGVPSAVELSISTINEDELLSWTVPTYSAFSIAEYEIRHGNTWDTAVFVARVKANNFRRKINYGGTRRYWVAAVDVANSTGVPSSQLITIEPPGPVGGLRADVIDNNVLVYWTRPTTGTLPIDRYEIRKGETWESGLAVGSNGTGTFAAIFEQQGGEYTYLLRAFDTANNAGSIGQIVALVNQPPDYLLRNDYDSLLDGTLSSVIREEDGSLVAPVNTTETWEQHFQSRGWSSIQDQIDAGYPVYIQPPETTGYYEEVIDYGAVLPATIITASISNQDVVGVVGVSVQISYKADIADPWIDGPANSPSVLGVDFRFVKLRYTFTPASGGGVTRVTGINVKLSIKLKMDSGEGFADASDVGGTYMPFTVQFIDADTPIVQANSTVPVVSVVDFLDTPYPAGFRVYMFRLSDGVRVSANFGWQTRGY